VRSARIDELLELMGLSDRAGDRVSRYSMGMKQRLGIAVALLHDPKLLLLDEPANGLDPSGIVKLRDTLKALAASGKTVFISSHILPEVQQMADIVGIVAAVDWSLRARWMKLLTGQALVKVKVKPEEAAAGAGGRGEGGRGRTHRDLGPRCRLADGARLADRAADINRALADAAYMPRA